MDPSIQFQRVRFGRSNMIAMLGLQMSATSHLLHGCYLSWCALKMGFSLLLSKVWIFFVISDGKVANSEFPCFITSVCMGLFRVRKSRTCLLLQEKWKIGVINSFDCLQMISWRTPEKRYIFSRCVSRMRIWTVKAQHRIPEHVKYWRRKMSFRKFLLNRMANGKSFYRTLCNHLTGEEPAELLAEPCAINCFDIDKQNPSVSTELPELLLELSVSPYSSL